MVALWVWGTNMRNLGIVALCAVLGGCSRWLLSIAVVSALLLGASASRASDDEQIAAIYGIGSESCGRFVAAATDNKPGAYRAMTRPEGSYVNDLQRYQQWMMGFVSAINSTRPNLDSQIKVDLAGMDLWLRNWCNQHPTDSVYHGLMIFTTKH